MSFLQQPETWTALWEQVVLVLQWLPSGWCPLLEPEAQLLEEPGGLDAHSAGWLALLDGGESPIGLVEGVAADLITKSLALARTQRFGEKTVSLLLRAAMHLCTGGAARNCAATAHIRSLERS